MIEIIFMCLIQAVNFISTDPNKDNEATKEIELGLIKAIWVLFYGRPKSKNDLEAITSVLLLLQRDPPSTNQYWTLSDLHDNIKKTYADIQKAVTLLEDYSMIETGKDWVKNQGNKRYIKLKFLGQDFLGSCKLIAGKNIEELKQKLIKKQKGKTE